MIKPSDFPARKPENAVPSTPDPKKPYVRPEHLMQRPFQGNPMLEALKGQVTRKNQPNYKIRKK